MLQEIHVIPHSKCLSAINNLLIYIKQGSVGVGGGGGGGDHCSLVWNCSIPKHSKIIISFQKREGEMVGHAKAGEAVLGLGRRHVAPCGWDGMCPS
jgi:hypothetical protein